MSLMPNSGTFGGSQRGNGLGLFKDVHDSEHDIESRKYDDIFTRKEDRDADTSVDLIKALQDGDESPFLVKAVPIVRDDTEEQEFEIGNNTPFPSAGLLPAPTGDVTAQDPLQNPLESLAGVGGPTDVLNSLGPSIQNLSRFGEFGGGFGASRATLKETLRRVLRNL